jgi:putative nucleotidyltransferase with HDIG domain
LSLIRSKRLNVSSTFFIKFKAIALLTRDEALSLVRKHVSKRNIFYHMLAVEAIMRALARYFGEDEEKWGLVGLVHDIDYEQTETMPEKHGLVVEQIIGEKLPEELMRAIKAHSSKHTGVEPKSIMEKALIASDAISGLLVACALVMPSKKMAEVKLETVARKFKDKDFARGADRERILLCEEIGLPREKFFEISLNALKEIASEIGL